MFSGGDERLHASKTSTGISVRVSAELNSCMDYSKCQDTSSDCENNLSFHSAVLLCAFFSSAIVCYA